jgi:hypothetical protein
MSVHPAYPHEHNRASLATRNMPAASLPFKTLLLTVTKAPVDVELARRRREALTSSCKRGSSEKLCPSHGGGVVHVQVLKVTNCGVGCMRRGRVEG